MDDFSVNANAIDESTYIPPLFVVTITPVLTMTTLIFDKNPCWDTNNFCFHIPKNMTTPVAYYYQSGVQFTSLNHYGTLKVK